MRAIKQSHLRVFVTVAELGSISAAAQRLHRSPSAVSMTVANLEAQLDRPLFEADSKSRLTPFGRYVFEVASEQINRFDRALVGIRSYARNDFGRIDMATLPSFAMRYLPAILQSFIARYPRVTLSISDASSAAINAMVEHGDIDIGIASLVSNSPGVVYHPLLSDLLGVVCSRDHRLARLQRPLRWDDLGGENFIANGTCSLIRDPSFAPILERASIEVENTTSLLALVAVGVGITTLPQLAVSANPDGVCFKPMKYQDLIRSIGLITPANRSLTPAAGTFADLIKTEPWVTKAHHT